MKYEGVCRLRGATVAGLEELAMEVTRVDSNGMTVATKAMISNVLLVDKEYLVIESPLWGDNEPPLERQQAHFEASSCEAVYSQASR